MEPTNQHEQTEPFIHETEQARCDTERPATASMAETTTNQKPIDDSKAGEPVYTSQWLRDNTEIHGWLAFIIYWYFPIGALLSILVPICIDGFDVITFLGTLLFMSPSVVTVCLFHLRRPNAVFYACLSLRITCLSYITCIVFGLFPLLESIIRLVTGIAFLLYFGLSEQVKDVIPLPFRKVSKLDRIVYWGILTLLAILYSLIALDYSIVHWGILIVCFLCLMPPKWGTKGHRS